MNSTSTHKIRNRVKAKERLKLFTIDTVQQGESYHATTKELSRMASNGQVKRLKTGIYYKPKKTKFGELVPREGDVLSFLLKQNGKQVGYVSGERAYNSLGLTNQISSVVTIATEGSSKKPTTLGGVKVRYVKAYGNPKTDNHHLLQILDAMKDIRMIPDSNILECMKILGIRVKELDSKDQSHLIKIAKKYPKRVRVLLSEIINDLKRY